MLTIERCVCTGHCFEDLKEMARDGHLDFRGLQDATGCGLCCGLCVPYIKAMLTTGQTVFHELLVEGRAARQRGPKARTERHSRQLA